MWSLFKLRGSSWSQGRDPPQDLIRPEVKSASQFRRKPLATFPFRKPWPRATVHGAGLGVPQGLASCVESSWGEGSRVGGEEFLSLGLGGDLILTAWSSQTGGFVAEGCVDSKE